ncbi:MAG: endolytic transglycosylase MltG [Candidatus Binatia bacterium]
MRKFLLTVLFLSLSLLLFLISIFVFLYMPAQQKRHVVEVKVDRGESFSSVVNKLKDRGVIPSERFFTFWARLWALDKKIHWGVYRFDLPIAPREVLDRMVLGRGLFHRITIPEGLALSEIADLLGREGATDEEKFLKEARSTEILSLLGLEDSGIEGYLFPDTYYFPVSATERDILTAMVEQFQEIFTPMMERQAKKLGLSRHEVVTLASLVEKEAGVETERPLVSAVFHNRLKQNIPLQSDPTVIYGLEGFTGKLRRRDLQNPSPYNTYLIRGLPPGPICNPGLSSLRAALFPAHVSYLYFVSKNDGTHFFSETIREHNRAVNIYQRNRKQPKRH